MLLPPPSEATSVHDCCTVQDCCPRRSVAQAKPFMSHEEHSTKRNSFKNSLVQNKQRDCQKLVSFGNEQQNDYGLFRAQQHEVPQDWLCVIISWSLLSLRPVAPLLQQVVHEHTR
jgi:hypothetical protein